MTRAWRSTYEERLGSAAEGVAGIKAGDRVFVATAAGEPRHLVAALTERAPELADVELMQFHTLSEAKYTADHFRDRIRANALFASDSMRDAVADCEADYTPVFLSHVPALFRSRRIPIDTALISVTPPDEHGFCSLGLSVDITKAAVESAGTVIAQVNPKMPWTFGASVLHVSEIDHFIEHEEALLESPLAKPEEVHQEIAAHISRLIPDGATIQVGAGRIPNAVVQYLSDKSDLGVHTELFSDGLMELVRKGVVTCRRKSFHPGNILASMVMGSQALYEFAHRNPMLELHPSDYINDPVKIAANNSMVAINSGLEVDLTGQICADSLGYRFYSGMGGHADFTRGAALAPDGKPIVALPSTADTPQGTVSRIVPFLKEGAGVLTTRGDVHYVVTEHGIAYLHGKSVRQRAMALIAIAHPEFRQDLLHAAKSRRLVFASQIIPQRGVVYPQELESKETLPDGREVLLRPVKATDDEGMKDLFYSFSKETVYLRFKEALKEMPHRRRQVFCNVDYQQEMALVAALEQADREEFIGVGRYMQDEGTRSAELGFSVRDDWQGKGIGSLIFGRLAEVARSRGIDRFTASLLPEAHAMLNVLRNSGLPITMSGDAEMVKVVIDLTSVEPAT